MHVAPRPGELGRVYQPSLAVLSGVAEFAAAAPVVDGSRWAEWTAAARADYEAWVEHAEAPGDGVDLGEVIAHLRDALDDDAVLTNGAGNFSGWVARFYQWRRFGTQLGPQSGAMGYGVPAALAAQARCTRSARSSRSRATATSRCAGWSSPPPCRRGCRSS